jgi:hypothetical protein
MKTLDHHRYHGHYPGHWRDAYLEAIEAYRYWKPGQPEPTIDTMALNQNAPLTRLQQGRY